MEIIPVDRISNLPKPVLQNIVSRLLIRDAVATGCLSKKWEGVWKSIQDLHFESYKEEQQEKKSPSKKNRNKKQTKNKPLIDVNQKPREFIPDVNQFLASHSTNLNRFSLVWLSGYNAASASTWILKALDKNVREMHLHLPARKLGNELHTRLFCCCSRLRLLHLDCRNLILPSVSIPRLETLTLISCFFKNDESFVEVLDGCPVLSYLFIDMNLCSEAKHKKLSEFRVSSPCLTHLEIHAHPTDSVSTILVHAPSLRFFKFTKMSNVEIKERLSRLDEGTIEIVGLENYLVDNDQTVMETVIKTVFYVNGAKSLDLSRQVTLALCYVEMEGVFNNLTRLDVEMDLYCWNSLQDLIRLSDNLQILRVKREYVPSHKRRHGESSNWKNLSNVPRCLSMSLSGFSFTFSYRVFEMSEEDKMMINYISEHGAVLRDVAFKHVGKNRGRKIVYMRDWLLNLRWKSQNCSVFICGFD